MVSVGYTYSSRRRRHEYGRWDDHGHSTMTICGFDHEFIHFLYYSKKLRESKYTTTITIINLYAEILDSSCRETLQRLL